MNRRSLYVKKTKNALEVGLALVILFNLFSCASIKNETTDHLIIEDVLKKICSVNNEIIYFNVNSDNSTIVAIYEESFKDNHFVNNENNKQWLSKGKTTYSDADVLILKDVFTEENYNFIKDRVRQSYWEKEKIKIPSCDVIFLNEKNEKVNVSINRPVYTKNNYALIGYAYKNTISLLIFKKHNGRWVEVKTIPLGLV